MPGTSSKAWLANKDILSSDRLATLLSLSSPPSCRSFTTSPPLLLDLLYASGHQKRRSELGWLVQLMISSSPLLFSFPASEKRHPSLRRSRSPSSVGRQPVNGGRRPTTFLCCTHEDERTNAKLAGQAGVQGPIRHILRSAWSSLGRPALSGEHHRIAGK